MASNVVSPVKIILYFITQSKAKLGLCSFVAVRFICFMCIPQLLIIYYLSSLCGCSTISGVCSTRVFEELAENVRDIICELLVLSNHSELAAFSQGVVQCLCPSTRSILMSLLLRGTVRLMLSGLSHVSWPWKGLFLNGHF